MGQDPSQIRQDIEQTREQMGNTVEALGHKTDVTGRAKEAVSDKVDTLRSKVSGTTPDSDDVKQGARRAAGVAQENPLGLAVAALAGGFLAGLVIPSTKVEDEKIGPVADQVMEIWLAALVVAVAYAVIAAVLAMTGKQKVKQAVPPVPEQAKDSVKEDMEWAKTQARSGRT